MILETEKEFRLIVQVAVATTLACWGFPFLALVLVLLVVPWQPIYRMAAYLGGVVVKISARATVKKAMRKLHEEPVQVT